MTKKIFLVVSGFLDSRDSIFKERFLLLCTSILKSIFFLFKKKKYYNDFEKNVL